MQKLENKHDTLTANIQNDTQTDAINRMNLEK